MEKAKMERIVKTYYDALEEGRILGRKCTRCGHIEYPPYLICNTCGCLDTEWVEMNNAKFYVNQVMEPAMAFSEPAFKANVGEYLVAAIRTDNSDEFGSCIINIDPARCNELRAKVPFAVKPVIKQDEDVKMVMWEVVE